MNTLTEREAQIEALWTYEVATEKVLRRSVKKGYITQKEAEKFTEKLFVQLNTDNIPGYCPSSLGEKMRMEDIRLIINRLSRIYSHIFIDEVQDLAGYDLELIKLFIIDRRTFDKA